MRKIGNTFLATLCLAAVAVSPTRARTQLDEQLEYAEVLGALSGIANRCKNLTLARDRALKSAIRVFWRSRTPEVRRRFHATRGMMMGYIRMDPEQHCAEAEKDFPELLRKTPG